MTKESQARLKINKLLEDSLRNAQQLSNLKILKSNETKETGKIYDPQITNLYDTKINSIEFNNIFEKVLLDKLETEYKVTPYGIYNLKDDKIESFSNSNIITKYISDNIKVSQEKVNIVEYQSPADILLDGQLENGAIEIDIKYKDILLLNHTVLLDDYKYGAQLEDKQEFIKGFIPKMKEHYINCLAYIFENMKI